MAKALVVGGCPASYHRLEPAEPPLRSVLEGLGLEVDVTGIYHPGGGDAYRGDYSMLSGPYLPQYDLVVLYTTGKERHGADTTLRLNWTFPPRSWIPPPPSPPDWTLSLSMMNCTSSRTTIRTGSIF